MANNFRLEDDIIYRINDDGSVSQVAELDTEDSDIKPIGKELWYSEQEDEIVELQKFKENYQNLIPLVSKSNTQLTNLKDKIFKFGQRKNVIPIKKIASIKAISIMMLLGLISVSCGIFISFFQRFLVELPTYLIVTLQSIPIIITLVMLCIILFFVYDEIKIDQLYNAITIDSEKSSLIHCNDEAVYDFASDIDLSKIPIIISDVLIANTDYNGNIETNYGERISSEKSMYLKPKIKFFGIKSGVQTLRIRWIRPNGSISKGGGSIGDFSQVSGYSISSGKNDELILSGWGNSTKGHWTAGQYYIEIWYDDIRLIRKPFNIY